MKITAKIAAELAERVKGGDGLAMDYASRMRQSLEAKNLPSDSVAIRGDGMVTYSDDLINPMNEKGMGDMRREIADYNSTIDPSYRQSFEPDTTYYHGTNADIDEFKPTPDGYGELGGGVYLTKSKDQANRYSMLSDGASNVIPLMVKGDDVLDGRILSEFPDEAYKIISDRSGTPINKIKSQYKKTGDINNILSDAGFVGIKNPESISGKDQIAVFDPSNIRSTNAAFDPAKKDSSNLLASLGAGTAAGAGLLASDDSEAGVINGIFSKGGDLARKADFITNMKAVERIPATDEGFSLQETWLNYIDDPIANKDAESLDLTLSELSDKYKKDIAMQVNDPSININSVLDNYSKMSGNFDNFLKSAQSLNNETAFQAKTLLNQKGQATVPGMIGGTLATGGLMASDDSEASFIGTAAKTWDRSAEALAKKMTDEGASRDEIWQATGQMGSPTFKDVDGKWKQEISDQDAYLDSVGNTGYERIVNESLNDAYGFDKTLQQSISKDLPEGGAYYPYSKTLKAGGKNRKSSALHELQHAIQEQEGFATGGNIRMFGNDINFESFRNEENIFNDYALKAGADPGSFVKAPSDFELYDGGVEDYINDIFDSARGKALDVDYKPYLKDAELEVRSMYADDIKSGKLSEPEINNLIISDAKMLAEANFVNDFENAADNFERAFDRSINLTPKQQYERLAGEAEARNVQTRLDYDMDKRVSNPPWNTLDVPEDELIARGQRGRATPRDMAVGTGIGLTSVAIADAYKDYMAKDKALADASLFNFGRAAEQAPENFLNSVQDVASLSGLGDLVRGFALPVATTVGGIDEFNQVNDFISEFEQPQTRAVNYLMDGVTDAILPFYKEISPYIIEDYNAIGSSEWPDDYRNPKYRGALNLVHDMSRGTYSALTGTTRFLEDKFKE